MSLPRRLLIFPLVANKTEVLALTGAAATPMPNPLPSGSPSNLVS